MKWFWYSLIGFLLLMCSCKTKKLDSSSKVRNEVQSELSYFNENVKIDTTRTSYTEQLSENKVIKETIIITEYDKDSGIVTQKTETTRQIIQGVETNIKQTEERKVTELSNDSLKLVVDDSEIVDIKEEIKEESGTNPFWSKFGLSLGIGITCLIAGFLLYLWKRLY